MPGSIAVKVFQGLIVGLVPTVCECSVSLFVWVCR